MGDNLFQKTFHGNSAEEIDKQVNNFRENNEIRYTHSHVSYIETPNGRTCLYDYVVFYLPKKSSDQSKQVPDQKVCPGCGENIPVSFEYHMKCGWSQ